MKIIIAGVGKVGSTLTRQLSAPGYDITLIDVKQQVLEANVEKYDVMAVLGNCATMETLLQAGVNDADLLIAMTGADAVSYTHLDVYKRQAMQLVSMASVCLGSAYAALVFRKPLEDFIGKSGQAINPNVLDGLCVTAISLVLCIVTMIFGRMVPKLSLIHILSSACCVVG